MKKSLLSASSGTLGEEIWLVIGTTGRKERKKGKRKKRGLSVPESVKLKTIFSSKKKITAAKLGRYLTMSASFSHLFQYYIIVLFPNPEETMYIKYVQ